MRAQTQPSHMRQQYYYDDEHTENTEGDTLSPLQSAGPSPYKSIPYNSLAHSNYPPTSSNSHHHLATAYPTSHHTTPGAAPKYPSPAEIHRLSNGSSHQPLNSHDSYMMSTPPIANNSRANVASDVIHETPEEGEHQDEHYAGGNYHWQDDQNSHRFSEYERSTSSRDHYDYVSKSGEYNARTASSNSGNSGGELTSPLPTRARAKTRSFDSQDSTRSLGSSNSTPSGELENSRGGGNGSNSRGSSILKWTGRKAGSNSERTKNTNHRRRKSLRSIFPKRNSSITNLKKLEKTAQSEEKAKPKGGKHRRNASAGSIGHFYAALTSSATTSPPQQGGVGRTRSSSKSFATGGASAGADSDAYTSPPSSRRASLVRRGSRFLKKSLTLRRNSRPSDVKEVPHTHTHPLYGGGGAGALHTQGSASASASSMSSLHSAKSCASQVVSSSNASHHSFVSLRSR